MTFTRSKILVLTLLTAAAWPPPAPASVMVEMVVDTSTAIPGGTGSFTGFSSKVSIDRGDLAFIGTGVPVDAITQWGVYTHIGSSLDVVADINTPVPSGTGTFRLFGIGEHRNRTVSIDGGSVAFAGEGTADFGIYTDLGGELKLVVAAIVDVWPGTVTPLLGFNNPSLGGGNVVFHTADFVSNRGLLKGNGGPLSIVVTRSFVVLPDGEPSFGAFDFNGFAPDGDDLGATDIQYPGL